MSTPNGTPFGKMTEKDTKEESKKTNTPDTSKKPSTKKNRKPSKPEGFKEFESLAKGIIESDGNSYFEWLHEKHQEIILEFNVQYRKQVTEVANKKGE
ncbi:hypothetical protein CFK37_03875 [Virgibacillus phasianinus]|uniref:Uncharacterized protein n=1 Tax=Virgibacillus phasianinus TaxID=2017483 RepID=A0A220U009_9BACI|nr:hypothetical protein [Virgibacillus phasianinus]ASK61370.1 hypothetical protein CFK37_03875 [Virgibacillus phasianinus]